MTNNNNDTAAWASIEDVGASAASVDAQVRVVLGRVMAQRRSIGTAFRYMAALSRGTRANCWDLAEAAGYEGQHRMQALLCSYVWDWKDLRAELPGLAAAWLPDLERDLIGPGIAIDETAHLKHGDATACVAPQHAGCTGKVENCVTTVFSACVTANGQAWADFDVYMPRRWADDLPRRRAAGIPDDLAFATKPDLAIGQVQRLRAAGLALMWAAFDEVYGRSGKLRKACRGAGLAYVAIIPCDWQVTLPSGAVISAEDAVKDAVFERRSCGTGTKGPRFSDWAMTATSTPGEYLLIRRLISRPDQYTFYLCWALLAAAVFAHESAAFGVDVLAGAGGDVRRGCRAGVGSGCAEEAGECGDGFEQQGVEAGLLVGGAAGAEVGDGAAVPGLGGELADPGGHGGVVEGGRAAWGGAVSRG